MIIYRRIAAEDRDKVNAFITHNGIEYDGRLPLLGFISVEKETGDITGVILAHQVALIEPMVCKSASSAVKLYYMLQGALSAVGLNTSVVHVKGKTPLNGELQKLGYEEINEDFIIFKRV